MRLVDCCESLLACIVTRRSSTMTSFVRLRLEGNYGRYVVNACLVHTHKSAPIVALYWLLNRLLTYWFMSDVFPTLNKSEFVYWSMLNLAV